MTNSINKQLIKDYKFPIPVTEEPYFSHYANLLDGFYSINEARHQLTLMCEDEGGFEAALGKTRKLIATIVDHVLAKDEYQAFQDMDMNLFRGIKAPEKQTLYHRSNADKKFIALDMKKANFQALRSIDPVLVDGFETWEGFLGQFTTENYYLNCKQIRQVVFGQLNPKRQQTVQKYRMAKVFNNLISLGVDESSVFSSSPDEIVIEHTDLHEETVKSLASMGVTGLHVDIFQLKLAHPEKPFFVKQHVNNDKIELKGVPKSYVPEVVRHLRSEEPDPMDRFFMHEGRLCQFSAPLYI